MSEIYTGSMSSSEQAQVRLGGMALRNGMLVHSLDHWAAAVRGADGEIRLASGRKPELPAPALRVPALRGVLRVAEAVYLLPLVRRPAARGAAADGGADGIAGALAASAVLDPGACARGRLRPAAAEVARRRRSRWCRRWRRCAARAGPLPRRRAQGDRRLRARRGAVDIAKEHERCGSHLVAPMIAATVAGNVLVSRLPAARRGPARLAVSLAAIGIATETFGWMQRQPREPLAQLMLRPGFALQRVGGDRASRPPRSSRSPAPRCDEVLRLEDSGGRP